MQLPSVILRGVAVLLLLVTVACTDTVVSNKYCNLPAHFTYSPVVAISQLYSACNSQGEWTTITARNKQFIFTNLSGSTTVNQTQLDNYHAIYMGLSGFIVGLPNIPELGSDLPTITCYDLACSNCYKDNSVTRPLQLQPGGFAYCKSCQRTYNLNNLAQISRGEAGITLFRYHVYYGNNTLTISNSPR